MKLIIQLYLNNNNINAKLCLNILELFNSENNPMYVHCTMSIVHYIFIFILIY